MAHNSTVFAQLLKLVPRHEFEGLAREHGSGRKARKLTRWSQFVAMGMAQLAGRSSLRDIVSNLSAQSRKLYHLGAGEVSRSSLSRVNADKPWELYEALFGRLLSRCRASSPGHGFRFKNRLYSLDATVIDLCLSMFPWAKFRRAKGALKVHVGMDHEGRLPTFVAVTEGRTSDIEVARTLRLPKGSIVAGGSGVSGLRVDQLVDSARGLPGDAAQEGDQVPSRGAARSEPAAGRHVRPDHRVHERARAPAVPAPAAADRLPRPGDREALRPPDDQLPAVGEDDRGHLQVALAGGAVLQVDQAEPEGEELRGHLAQRGHDAALDRHVHVPAGVPSQVRQPPRLEPRRNPAPSPTQSIRAPTSR